MRLWERFKLVHIHVTAQAGMLRHMAVVRDFHGNFYQNHLIKSIPERIINFKTESLIKLLRQDAEVRRQIFHAGKIGLQPNVSTKK